MNTTRTEHYEAIALKQYLDILVTQKKVVCYSHIANETFIRSFATRRIHIAEGKHAGVPDYIVVTPHGILFIELKRIKGSIVSDKQTAWIKAINNVGNYLGNKDSDCDTVHAAVVKGFDEAKKFLDENV